MSAQPLRRGKVAVLGAGVREVCRRMSASSYVIYIIEQTVDKIEKTYDEKTWKVDTSRLTPDASEIDCQTSTLYDAVVVTNGNYHAPNIPSIPGLASWQQRFPARIKHPKGYRNPSDFRDQSILLIGAGVSSMDIARYLASIARSVFQSRRGGVYDTSSVILAENAARVDGVEVFVDLEGPELAEDGSLPGTITLRSGRKLCRIHQVILCTGYHLSFPFLRQLHADGVSAEEVKEEVLVTNGQQTHNLHKDIWYIPDPTLAFIGVPYHVATWSLFEFQAIALAATFAGRAVLPPREEMREMYIDRLQRKGAGRPFHSLRAPEDETLYVSELIQIVNNVKEEGENLAERHSTAWLEAYGRRGERYKALFGHSRNSALDERLLSSIAACR